MSTIAINTMTLEEKLATMEQIWDDLCQRQNVQSPDWHGDVLQSREEKRVAGGEEPMDWRDAKQAILKRVE
jgi:hypothetical protein